MSDNQELTQFLLARASLNERTKVNYVNCYKRIMTLTNNKEVISLTENKLIKLIQNAVNLTDHKKLNQPLPVSMKQSLLNVIIVIREIYDKSIDELKAYRDMSKGDLMEEIMAKNEELKESLPTPKELETYTDDLFTKGKHVKYVINYLLINYNVRNMDLNLLITRNGRLKKENENFLIIRANSLLYVRYNFKTAEKYICRTNEIRSVKMHEAVSSILGAEETKPLLTKLNGERLTDANLNLYISRATYKQLGQSKYFKTMLQRPNANVEQMSVNRGSSLNTILEYYDIDFNNEELKQEKQNVMTLKCNKSIKAKVLEQKTLKSNLKNQEIENAISILKP
jgi:hypothetical protein